MAGVVSATAVMCLWLIHQVPSQTISSPPAQEAGVGRVRTRINDVRRRSANDFDWNSLPAQSNLFNHDGVFTGEKSKAEIELRNGSRVSVAPNSLVIISVDAQRKDNLLKLGKGSFVANAKAGHHFLLQEKKGQTQITSNDALLRVEKTDSATRITVLSGSLEVNQNGRKISIAQNQTADVTTEGKLSEVRTFPLRLKSPEPEALLWQNPSSRVDLSWMTAENVDSYKVEISTDSEFKTIIQTQATEKTSLSFQPPGQGVFHWRVSSRDKSGNTFDSVAWAFTIVPETRPLLVKPQDQGQAVIEKQSADDQASGPRMTFEWKDDGIVDSFHLQVARSKSFHERLIDRVVESPSFISEPLGEGNYYWRVRSLHEKRTNAPWSDVRSFSIVTRFIRLPPPHMTELEYTLGAPTGPLLEWEKVSGASGYQIQLATEAHPHEIKVRHHSTESHLKLAGVTEVKKTSPRQLASQEGESELPQENLPSVTPRQTSIVEPIPPHSSQPPANQTVPPVRPAEEPASNAKRIEAWVWAGVGVNYQYYQQTAPAFRGDIQFQNIKGPTSLLRGGFQGPRWGLDLSFKDTPGEIASSSQNTVSGGLYHWQTLTAEGLYRTQFNGRWNVRFGVQHHLTPFMSIDPTNGVVNIRQNTLTMGTLGFDWWTPLSDDLRFEWMTRYQHPIDSGSTNGDDFQIYPKYAFDGSLGGVYYLSRQIRLGFYWYGQWHQYSFQYSDRSTAQSYSGDQTLFYSNIELRFGYEF